MKHSLNTQTAINCDTFWLQTLGTHVIVLWQIQKIMLLYCFCFVLRCIWGTFQVLAPGGLYSEGRFNGGIFCVTSWRGLFSEFYGILPHVHIMHMASISYWSCVLKCGVAHTWWRTWASLNYERFHGHQLSGSRHILLLHNQSRFQVHFHYTWSSSVKPVNNWNELKRIKSV